MSKQYHERTLAAGMMLFAISLYAQAPTMNTFILQASAKDGVEDAQDSGGSDSNDKQEKSSEKHKESEQKSRSGKSQSGKSTRTSEKSDSASSRGRDHAEDDGTENEFYDSNDDNNSEIEDDGDGDDDSVMNGSDDDSQAVEDNHGGRGGSSDDRNARGGLSIAAVTKKIAQTEEYVTKKQQDGKNVTLASEKLTQAKNLLATLDPTAPDTKATESLLRDALKLAHDSKEELHGNNDVNKFIRKADERIRKASEKLARYIAAGGNGAMYQGLIDIAIADVTQAKTLVEQNDLTSAVAAAQKSEAEAKSAKNAIESAMLALGISDDELSGEHKSAVAQAVEELLFVANATDDEHLGSKVREIARSQRDSAAKVNDFVDDAQARGKLAEFLLGPKYSDLNGITGQIAENEDRIDDLTKITAELNDDSLKQVVHEHIDALNQENQKLAGFVAGKEQTKGIFGWFFRLLHA